ncbi:GNAT family N-acetyltransferase [Aestuariibacter sp. AA17]|uniref:GNAT family N-acetyltransferase n=1 Tax=Fluctibacter corallii TaxID=2984329 RepID=A0ABT3A4U7_9ALTE|nr:GNAT family N-acetyltransferase [Aestuariibacter sp. AA17]MCV2883707.1 GNAT family N-acetyltransferase [Aestuariibacter sp. AA17]
MDQIEYQQLAPSHFEGIIALGNHVHGDNYINHEQLEDYYQKSVQNNINASWVALLNDKVIGFRLTFAAGTWTLDEWCSTDEWPVKADEVCYFKCNTVDEICRGKGVGSKLLSLSIENAKKQGAKAGMAHIWMASPGNSAFKYFSKCGGKVVKMHPNKWQPLFESDGYVCPVCGNHCTCTGAEMMIEFD